MLITVSNYVERRFAKNTSSLSPARSILQSLQEQLQIFLYVCCNRASTRAKTRLNYRNDVPKALAAKAPTPQPFNFWGGRELDLAIAWFLRRLCLFDSTRVANVTELSSEKNRLRLRVLWHKCPIQVFAMILAMLTLVLTTSPT